MPGTLTVQCRVSSQGSPDQSLKAGVWVLFLVLLLFLEPQNSGPKTTVGPPGRLTQSQLLGADSPWLAISPNNPRLFLQLPWA